MLKKLFWFFVVVSFFGMLLGVGVCTWGYFYFTRDLPLLTSIDDYRPPAVTRVLSSEGKLVGEFYRERRYPAKFAEIPLQVRQAFLAAEDALFYKHPGINPLSIIRAFIKNIESGSTTQGGSTITQQVVKNLLLTPEKRLNRKIKEAILSYRLEERLSKDEILEIYLNQIFFGNTAYGIKAAAKLYFHKELSEVTLAEGALLAGLPKAPSKFSPLTNLPRAKRRQKYVLGQMVKAGFITDQQADDASAEKIKVYPATQQNIFDAPYFVSEVRRVFADRWKDMDLEADGLEIQTTLDTTANKLAEKALRKGLREVDKRRGWRGPLEVIRDLDKSKFLEDFSHSIAETVEPEEVYPALVLEVNRQKGVAKVDLGNFTASVDLRAATWAKKRLDKEDHTSWIKPDEVIRPGDVVEVSEQLSESPAAPVPSAETKLPEGVLTNVVLDQTPEIEGALVLIDPNTGRINTMIGGYSYQRSVFNRVTQSYRQPGSTFKPVVYLAAVDGYKYTPATIVYDSPKTLRVGDEIWSPGNYDQKFLGPITLRTALEKSKNMVSVDIVSRIGVNPIIRYARKLGITSPLGRNPSIALGSSEVTLLELTRAYGTFPAKGILVDSYMISKILDRSGKVLYDHEDEALSSARQVINENSAFIMANMMKGVIQNGTATAIKPLNRPAAGKTGTTNDFMDAWFIGYTPQWVCGIWTGFDVKRTIGEKETGGKIAAPIWLHFMDPFLKYRDDLEYARLVQDSKAEAERLGIEFSPPEKLEPLDFSVPDGVDPFWINKATGSPASPGEPGAIYEYFLKGTEPTVVETHSEETNQYLDSPDL